VETSEKIYGAAGDPKRTLKEAATLASVCTEQIRTLAAQKRRASDSRPQIWPHERIGVGAHPSTRAHQQCCYVTPPLLRRGRGGLTTAAAAAAGACPAAGLTKGSGGSGSLRASAPAMAGRPTHDAARQHCPLPLHRRGGRGGRHPRCPRPACRPVTCRTSTAHRHTHCVVARPGRSVLWPAPPGTSCPSTPPPPHRRRRLFATPPPPISTAAPSSPLFSLTACHASVAPPHHISHVSVRDRAALGGLLCCRRIARSLYGGLVGGNGPRVRYCACAPLALSASSMVL